MGYQPPPWKMAKNAFLDFLGHPIALTTKVRQLTPSHIVATMHMSYLA